MKNLEKMKYFTLGFILPTFVMFAGSAFAQLVEELKPEGLSQKEEKLYDLTNSTSTLPSFTAEKAYEVILEEENTKKITDRLDVIIRLLREK